ncbi:MAG: 2OG-Fe(II) oxygenase [Rubrivivax sp.]|nr:2OG-Fe(II) oxygenase [Rubrivivax sp.]
MTVATQDITDDLRRWIVAQTETGCHAEDVLAAMRASGWAEGVAAAALEQTLRERLSELDRGAEAPAARSPVPEPDLAAAPTVLQVGGREARVLVTMQRPRVVVFGGLLSDDECSGLMALAAPRLARSETVDNATGGSEVNAARTSDGMFFERGEAPLIATIEARIAELLRWPLENGEGLQILRYGPGAEYRPHHDYFDLQHPGTPRILQRGGQRVGTLVMYLNTPEGGGATTFPDVGLDVAPVRGNAVFFSYDRAHPDTRTLHGGAPVTAGEKWVATKWLREGAFV